MNLLKNVGEDKNRLIEKGEKKINELKEIRKKMRTLNPDNPKDAEILEKLEDREIEIVHELSKLDVGVKVLEILEFIIRKGIFRGYWKDIEEKISYDELIEIIVSNGLNIKKICMEIYNRANINDEEILKNIEKLPDTSKKYNIKDEINNLEKIKERIKKLKILKNHFDKMDTKELKNMILKD